MSVYRGSGEPLLQFTNQRQQRGLLGGGAGVLGLAVAVKPSDIADSNGMSVVALAVGTGLFDGSPLVDAAIEIYYEMIAHVDKVPGQVPLADLLYGNVLPFPRCGAVDNDLIDASHGGRFLVAETGVSTPAS